MARHACCGVVRQAGEDGKHKLSFEPWLTCHSASEPVLAPWSGEVGPFLVHGNTQKVGDVVQHPQQALSDSHVMCQWRESLGYYSV